MTRLSGEELEKKEHRKGNKNTNGSGDNFQT